MLEQSVREGLHPMEEAHAGAVQKNCSLWEESMLEMFVKDCLLCEGPHAGTVVKFKLFCDSTILL